MFYESAFLNSKKDPRKTQQLIRDLANLSKTKDKAGPYCLKIHNQTINDPSTVSEHFNKYFGSIAEKLSESLTQPSKNHSVFMRNSPTSSVYLNVPSNTEIINIVQILNPFKSLGCDNIAPFFAENCMCVIALFSIALFTLI